MYSSVRVLCHFSTRLFVGTHEYKAVKFLPVCVTVIWHPAHWHGPNIVSFFLNDVLASPTQYAARSACATSLVNAAASRTPVVARMFPTFRKKVSRSSSGFQGPLRRVSDCLVAEILLNRSWRSG
jgi:hypothetical protein